MELRKPSHSEKRGRGLRVRSDFGLAAMHSAPGWGANCSLLVSGTATCGCRRLCQGHSIRPLIRVSGGIAGRGRSQSGGGCRFLQAGRQATAGCVEPNRWRRLGASADIFLILDDAAGSPSEWSRQAIFQNDPAFLQVYRERWRMPEGIQGWGHFKYAEALRG